MNWKKVALVFFGIVLAVYMVMAMTIFNTPDEEVICKGVSINMANGHVKGFLTEDDVKRMLTVDHINPQGQSMPHVNVRIIEETLRGKELIDSVECYKGQDGFVCIDIYQRIPVVRVMSQDGANYYVDNHGKPMPGTDYPCNLIVATGHITKAYAEKIVRRIGALEQMFPSKTFHPTLVSAAPARRNEYSEIFFTQLSIDDLFMV